MLQEWKKAKNIFKKPKLRVYFGLWSTPSFAVKLGNYLMKSGFEKHPFLTKVWHLFSRTDPSLPVWRRGNMIFPFRKHQVYNKGVYVWNDEFKNKLDKLHLGWIKCSYEVPIWLSCYIFCYDMNWKWKYDDVRYEFPPQFSIVLFNISLTFHWHAPESKNALDDDSYWESVLTWNYKQDEVHRDILNLGKLMGVSRVYKAANNNPIYKWKLSPDFLVDESWKNELRKKQGKWLTSVIEKDNFLKCDCGGHYNLNEDKVMLSNPVQYEYVCFKCHKTKYSTHRYDYYDEF